MPGRKDHRGSRKHVLDWVETSDFLSDIAQMVQPLGATVPGNAFRMPISWECDTEARLNAVGHLITGSQEPWKKIEKWWLAHPGKGNTPNWDLAVALTFPEGPGVLLGEGKAYCGEFSTAGKAAPRGKLNREPSTASAENHRQIKRAIDEASTSICAVTPGVSLTSDQSYQLANRIAYAWKIVQEGIPVVLLYVGFTGDDQIAKNHFRSEADWRECFTSRAKDCFPAHLIGTRLDWGKAPFWLLLEARPVKEPSTPLAIRTPVR